jgi:hypothetical protein
MQPQQKKSYSIISSASCWRCTVSKRIGIVVVAALAATAVVIADDHGYRLADQITH